MLLIKLISRLQSLLAKFMPLVVIVLFLIKFILIIVFRSCIARVSKAWNTLLAFLALVYCYLDEYCKLSFTALTS